MCDSTHRLRPRCCVQVGAVNRARAMNVCACNGGCHNVAVICLDCGTTDRMPYSDAARFQYLSHDRHAVLVAHIAAKLDDEEEL